MDRILLEGLEELYKDKEIADLWRKFLRSEGWLALFTAVRQQCSLSAEYREPSILYVAVLAYTEVMTRDIQVPDKVYSGVRKYFPDREIVELTATIAGYNLVSRFLEALRVDPEDNTNPGGIDA